MCVVDSFLEKAEEDPQSCMWQCFDLPTELFGSSVSFHVFDRYKFVSTSQRVVERDQQDAQGVLIRSTLAAVSHMAFNKACGKIAYSDIHCECLRILFFGI